MQRIHIIGTPGAGKTTLARHIAQRSDIPFVELDALFWGAHWMPATTAVFRQRVSASMRDTYWVVCGNHASVRDLVWARADTVIWLDYPALLSLSRLMGRAFAQILANLKAWLHGKRTPAFSNDSLLLYAMRASAERRADFAALFARPEYGHLRVLRFRAPEEMEKWLASMVVGQLGLAQRTQVGDRGRA